MGKLVRHLGFGSLLIYGIGDILGAGIYAVVGRVIETTGAQAWLVFIASAILATLTGMSYAEFSSRVPHAAGAAAFVKKAFSGKLIATLTGTLVLGTGIVSAATVTLAFSGYLSAIIDFPPFMAQILLVGALSFLSFWGIRESSRVNTVFTVVEVSGLLAVILVGATVINPQAAAGFIGNTLKDGSLRTLLEGITIAFFAFVGFEDLCNLADESKKPQRDIPRAIIGAIIFSTALYIAVTITLQLTVPLEQLSLSQTPLLLVFEQAGLGGVTAYFSLVAMLAVTNTGLANLIMASRLLYGMSKEGLLHRFLEKTHSARKTPWLGVVISCVATLALVLTGGVKILAQTTSLLVLTVFFMVHLSLVRVKRQGGQRAGWHTPIIVPFLGMGLTVVLAFFYPLEVYLRALILPVLGVILWGMQKFNDTVKI